MYYVPVTNDYWRYPANYVPVYSTTTTTPVLFDNTNVRLNNDLTKVQRELADLREELSDLRLENDSCRLCSAAIHFNHCVEDCSICYSRLRRQEREEIHARALSPVHYCSVCQDFVIDQECPPPSPSPRFYRKPTPKRIDYGNDKLSEYLSRQLDLHRLRHRRIPEERPIWIPTAYKHDYPHRRWITRQSPLSEP